MMPTPTITKKQEKKTLGTKKRKKETIKNTVAKPFNNYWPLITPFDNSELTSTLLECLPRLKPEKHVILYSEIKYVEKANRKTYRKDQNSTQFAPNKAETDFIVLGVNSVSNSLGKQQIGAILVASDIQPRLFIQHVVDQAVLFKVPLLIVQDLRKKLKSICGISSSTIGFLKSRNSSNKIKNIITDVGDMAKRYPVPKNHINYNRQLDIDDFIVLSDSEEQQVQIIPKIVIVKAENQPKFAYLQRKTSDKRAFIPEESTCGDNNKNERIETNFDGFLAFRPEPQEYMPMRVKRIRGDINREARKRKNCNQKRKRN